MFEAIVTFVTKDVDESSLNGWGNTVTKVYRVEFETEKTFNDWMKLAESCLAVTNVEQLIAS